MTPSKGNLLHLQALFHPFRSPKFGPFWFRRYNGCGFDDNKKEKCKKMEQNQSKSGDLGSEGFDLPAASCQEAIALIAIRKLNFEVMRQRIMNQFYINKWHRERSKNVGNQYK